MKVRSIITKITFLSAVVFAFAGLFAGEANGQTRRQIERERQRIERQQQRYEQQSYRNGRYDSDRNNTSRSAGLNNAVSMGYQQGLLAGDFDRRKKRFNQSNVYRNTGSAPNSGDPTSYDYLYRQGYLQGYNDGYYGRRSY